MCLTTSYSNFTCLNHLFCHKELYLPRDLVLFLALIILKSLASAFHENCRLLPCIENWDDSILHFVSSQFSSKNEIVVAQTGFSLGHQLTKKMTQRLFNYESMAISLSLFLTSSYNLNHFYWPICCYVTHGFYFSFCIFVLFVSGCWLLLLLSSSWSSLCLKILPDY